MIRVGQVLRLSSPTEAPATTAAGVQTAPLRTVPPPGTPEAAAPVHLPPQRPRLPAAPAPTSGRAQHRDVQDAAEGDQGAVLRAGIARRPARRIVAAAPPQGCAARRVARSPAPSPEPPPVVARVEPKPAPPPADGDEKVDWVWPAKGKIVTGFSEAASLKGIDIAGASGQPVAASAGGKVVYAGTGLRGYGKLIIIKHNGTFLSAYAHNKEILVKEGQQVTRGQKIAEMGNTDADQVKLHFEIRRQGKPVDPLRYLPPA